MEETQAEYGRVALEFATALVDGDFDKAHSLICQPCRADLPLAQLKAEYNEMIEYGDGPPDFVEIMETLTDWPSRADGDIGWAYVAISGDGFSEAVAVVVSEDGDNKRIREIEWGRP